MCERIKNTERIFFSKSEKEGMLRKSNGKCAHCGKPISIGVNIRNITTFEKILRTNSKQIADSLNNLQTNGERIQPGFYTEPRVIVNNVLKFLTKLRG